MPEDLPVPSQLWEEDVSFFSIDTDLIQSASFNFEEGVLNQLPKQLPRTIQLQLTEIVAKEIVRHRMEPVVKAAQGFKSSTQALRRSAGIDTDAIDRLFEEMDIEATAAARFRAEIEEYAQRCGGGVLPISGHDLASELFAQYFSNRAPFANSKNKKCEFPDAASFLLLEQYARTSGTKGIIASGDKGWSAYADKSERLYCAKSIEELAALFAATGEHAESVRKRILTVIEDSDSALRMQLTEAIEEHISNACWDVGDIYSGYVSRVEGETYGAEMVSYSLLPKRTNVWAFEGDPFSWVVELTASVRVQVDILATYFVWDSIDRQEMELGSNSFLRDREIEIQAFLTCSGVEEGQEPDTWGIDVEIAKGQYEVDVGEVEPDLS